MSSLSEVIWPYTSGLCRGGTAAHPCLALGVRRATGGDVGGCRFSRIPVSLRWASAASDHQAARGVLYDALCLSSRHPVALNIPGILGALSAYSPAAVHTASWGSATIMPLRGY